MITKMRHIGIVVDDFAESLRFYTLLGYKMQGSEQVREPSEYIDKISAGKNLKLTTLKLTGPDGSMIELLDYGNDSIREKYNMLKIGVSHIAFTVKDIEEVYRILTSIGIKANSPPQISPTGYVKLAFFEAPEGTYIELVEELK